MSKSRTTSDWQHTAVLSSIALSMALAGGCIARSEANLVIVAVSGLAAGAFMFFATAVLERIDPQC